MLRIQKLTDAIAQHFEELGPSDLDEKAGHFEHYVMDMYQVTKIQKTQIELTHLFNDKIVSPVIVDCDIHPYLRQNDTFLLGLGLRAGKWHVIYMSPPYHAENV